MRKQKSFTAKSESLKEVIKKSRLKIRQGGEREQVSVEIVVPKHMEHLLRSSPDLEGAVAQANPELEGADARESPDLETDESKEQSTEKETAKNNKEYEKEDDVEPEGRTGGEEQGEEERSEATSSEVAEEKQRIEEAEARYEEDIDKNNDHKTEQTKVNNANKVFSFIFISLSSFSLLFLFYLFLL